MLSPYEQLLEKSRLELLDAGVPLYEVEEIMERCRRYALVCEKAAGDTDRFIRGFIHATLQLIKDGTP